MTKVPLKSILTDGFENIIYPRTVSSAILSPNKPHLHLNEKLKQLSIMYDVPLSEEGLGDIIGHTNPLSTKLNFPFGQDERLNMTDDIRIYESYLYKFPKTASGQVVKKSNTSGITYDTEQWIEMDDIYNKGDVGFINLLRSCFNGSKGFVDDPRYTGPQNWFIDASPIDTVGGQLEGVYLLKIGTEDTIYPYTLEDYIIDDDGNKLSDIIDDLLQDII